MRWICTLVVIELDVPLAAAEMRVHSNHRTERHTQGGVGTLLDIRVVDMEKSCPLSLVVAKLESV